MVLSIAKSSSAKAQNNGSRENRYIQGYNSRLLSEGVTENLMGTFPLSSLPCILRLINIVLFFLFTTVVPGGKSNAE